MELGFFDAGAFSFEPEQLKALYPFLVLCVGMIFSTISSGLKLPLMAHKLVVGITLAVFAFSQAAAIGNPAVSLFGTSLHVDDPLRWLSMGIASLALVGMLFVDDVDHSEWSTLMLVSVAGMCLLPGARDWVAFFIYLETMAIPAYIMAAFKQRRDGGYEAGLKYLMMGAFASAIFLMGVTLIYGATGSFDFAVIFEVVTLGLPTTLLIAAALLVAVSLAFKVAMVPMHMWAADVYQAAPASLASFMAGAGKLSVFAALVLSFDACGLFTLDAIPEFFKVFGVLSLIIGNLVALKQKVLRRMLAYSSVASAGYVAIVVSLGEAAFPAIFVYLVTYGLALTAAFAVVESLSRKAGKHSSSQFTLSDLSSLDVKKCGGEVALLSVALFSMAGIPPFPGFLGKYLLISDVWTFDVSGAFWIILGSLMGLAYYLRILVPLYFEKTGSVVASENRSYSSAPAFLSACTACILLFVWVWVYSSYFTGPAAEMMLGRY